ncbi:MAG: hypothetical protein ACREGF_03730, partial [Candidatus Saccharimonadales bacterium]
MVGLGYLAKRVSPEERTGAEQEQARSPLQGELEGDDDSFKEGLRLIVAENLCEPPKLLYNPGSGEHVSLASAFPTARTIFSDTSGDVEHRFIQHNINRPDRKFEFYRADMHTFRLP